MRLMELAVLYGLVGLGCAVTYRLRIGGKPHHTLDSVLLILFWPLYGPFVLISALDELRPATAARSMHLVESLRRVSKSALAELLPDPRAAGALIDRLALASRKLAEIDALLVRPEFCTTRVEQRRQQLLERGDQRAAAIAGHRVSAIRRLGDLRDRFFRDLEEVRELLAQLHIQAEVVRIAESYDDGTRELVAELVHRVEGLDELLDAVHGASATDSSAALEQPLDACRSLEPRVDSL